MIDIQVSATQGRYTMVTEGYRMAPDGGVVSI